MKMVSPRAKMLPVGWLRQKECTKAVFYALIDDGKMPDGLRVVFAPRNIANAKPPVERAGDNKPPI